MYLELQYEKSQVQKNSIDAETLIINVHFQKHHKLCLLFNYLENIRQTST